MLRPAIADYSQVEEAIRLASREREVVTDRERVKNTARLIKYIALGLALVILSIGIAFWLSARVQRVEQSIAAPSAPIVVQQPAPVEWPPGSITTGSISQNKVVTKVNLFNSIAPSNIPFANSYFRGLYAGHEYIDSNSTAWDHAWCYANFEKGGLKFNVGLEMRRGTVRTPLLASQAERRELNLIDADISFLRSQCPWR